MEHGGTLWNFVAKSIWNGELGSSREVRIQPGKFDNRQIRGSLLSINQKTVDLRLTDDRQTPF